MFAPIYHEADDTGVGKRSPADEATFFDFPNDSQAAEVEDAFLFGPDLLVAPVTQFGARSREVYLPKGVEWVDVWTGELLPGGTCRVVDAPIEHIPVFARSANERLRDLFI